MKTIPTTLKTSIGVAVLAMFAAMSSWTHATTTIEYSPDADTYLNEASSSTNYGDNPYLSIRDTSSARKRIVYLRYDLSELEGTVTDASVTLTLAFGISVDRTASTLQMYGLDFDFTPGPGQEGLDWGQLTLNNTNAPWTATDSRTTPDYVSALGAVALPAGGGSSSGGDTYTVTGAGLIDFLNSAISNNIASVTFILVETVAQADSVNFASTENGTYAAPVLSITAIPESKTLSLSVGICALLFAVGQFSRKRR